MRCKLSEPQKTILIQNEIVVLSDFYNENKHCTINIHCKREYISISPNNYINLANYINSHTYAPFSKIFVIRSNLSYVYTSIRKIDYVLNCYHTFFKITIPTISIIVQNIFLRI